MKVGSGGVVRRLQGDPQRCQCETGGTIDARYPVGFQYLNRITEEDGLCDDCRGLGMYHGHMGHMPGNQGSLPMLTVGEVQMTREQMEEEGTDG